MLRVVVLRVLFFVDMRLPQQSPHIRLSGQSGKAPALHFRPRSVMAAGESYQMLSINRVGTEL